MKIYRYSFFAALLLVLIAVSAFAAGSAVAAEAFPAQDVSSRLWLELQNALLAAFYGALTAFGAAATGAVSTLAYKGWEWIKKSLASTRQGQLFGILTTALEIAVSKRANSEGKHYWGLVGELAQIFKDGKLSEAEKIRLTAIRKEILNDAALIAGDMIAECRGLAADEGAKYIRERLDALLGELEYRLTGSPAALIPSSVGDSPAAES